MPSAPNQPAQPVLRAYRRRQGWLAAVLAAQLVGGLAALAAPEREVFPLFSWFLFALTPQPEGRAVELRLAELGGRRFDPPVPLETERTLVAPTQAPAVVRLAKAMDAALAAGDAAALRRARQTLEENFLRGRGPGRYALVEVRRDPVARLRATAQQGGRGGPDAVIAAGVTERVLREFTLGEGMP
jgi:hypothetical protein